MTAISTGIAGIVLVGFLCQWLAWRIKLPAILFLLLSGIVLGPVTGWLSPDLLFDDMLFPMVSLAVAVILFEGSLTLEFHQIRDVSRAVRRLVSVGATITWVLLALSSHWLLKLDWAMAWLFGALVVVTGPTVIVPLLRSVRPNARVSNVLRWEGILIDPIGALLAVLVYEWIAVSHSAPAAMFGHTLLLFGKLIAVGSGIGLLFGAALGLALRRRWLPSLLESLAALALVLFAFTMSSQLAQESGLLAVTVMGIYLANQKDINTKQILFFKEQLTLLLTSMLFIVLAARLHPSNVLALGWPMLALLAALHFIVRPISVWASTLGSDLTWQEKVMLSWISPRGIVAAAISALFALRLEQAGYEQAGILVAATFSVIIGTVIFQSTTSRWLARALDVAEPEPRGFLIIGANPVARSVASALEQNNIPTQLVDPSWENIRDARMAGLKTFHGNALSPHADLHLDLVGYGNLLAMSPQSELNALTGLRYRSEFGTRNIFAVQSSREAEASRRTTIADNYRGRYLGTPGLTYARMASLLKQGAKIRSTKLTPDFDYTVWLKQYGRRRQPLLAISAQGHTHVFTHDEAPQPKPGWVLISLDLDIDSNDTNGQRPLVPARHPGRTLAAMEPPPKPAADS